MQQNELQNNNLQQQLEQEKNTSQQKVTDNQKLQQEIAQLNATLSEQKSIYESLEQKLHTRDDSISNLQTKLEEQESLVEEQNEGNKYKNMTIAALTVLSISLAIVSGLLAKTYFTGIA